MNIVRVLLKPFLGKRQFQFVFEAMYKTGLAGMNVGEGGKPKQSGEPWVLKFVSSTLARRTHSAVVFDVGANVGQYALAVLETFGPTVQLNSFEPCAAAFTALSKRLGNRANVTLIKAAVGSKPGQVEMFSPATASILSSVYNRSLKWDTATTEIVPVETIDGYCLRNNIRHIDFLKIDVEGHELEVIRGARQMLQSGAIQFIQFEVGDADIESRVFFRDFYQLLNEQYEICRVLQNGLAPIKEYKSELELFKRATNYLALRRHNRSQAQYDPQMVVSSS